MTDAQQREAARQFFYRWKGKGKEDEDARSYWIELLTEILGMDNVTKRVEFEKKVIGGDGNTKRIDVYIPETHVVIEQKSIGIALDKPQAGHDNMTPYEQAKMYDNYLPFDERARWIVTSNFTEIWIYDRNAAKPDPVKLSLSDFPTKLHMLDFLVKKEVKKVSDEMEISLQAGEIVGLLYDAFHKQYKNPDDPDTLKSLNKLCVRIVFLLYGEDAGILGKKNMFHDYMEQFDAQHARKGLRDLFRVLDQKPEDRDEFLADDDPLLAAFPYVNGGLFAGDDISIPPFTDKIMDLLLHKASADFDWSGISPTIFGAVFESTLNPETRRSGGMHYTSIENIHKVIDPLFLDDLKAELEEIKTISVVKTRDKRLHAFQDKLASLSFLDPAAGSGNFLTESYTSIRKLENEALAILTGGQISFGEAINPIKVSISQFYGIEINDFAVTVARTALWIAENQMMKETEDIVHMDLDFLPLKTAAHIQEGNALQIDWNDVVPKYSLNYIMGNPPFVGVNYMSDSQREDMDTIWVGVKRGKLDYVTCWYVKASEYIKGTPIRAALVSTNSVTQGEQASVMWKKLFGEGVHIDFAYRTFIWDSEASLKAHVHCVIVGFSVAVNNKKKYIYSDGQAIEAEIINGYLVDAPVVVIEESSKPLFEVPAIVRGSQATDDGYYLFTPEEKSAFLAKEPKAEKYFKRFMMGREFINNIERWCLWMPEINPTELKACPEIMKRVQKVKELRLASKNKQTQQAAMIPWRFGQYRPPAKQYIAFAKVSSERRRYIPFGFLTDDVIPGEMLFTIPGASMYMFGILVSNVHNAWMRTVAGRLKSDYRYSTTVVYNTFPWPSTTEDQKSKIEATAQAILDARALYPDASLADLYDPLTMPPELRKAHKANDVAVMCAYGMPIKETDEAACVAWLMRLYQDKTT